jgi:hypothetical protein
MKTRVINHTKKRKATSNEIAKKLIIDRVVYLIIEEQLECEGLNEKEIQEIKKHYLKHSKAIMTKLNPNNDRISF